MRITIIGAGMMGSAMAIPALDNGHSVRLVGTPLDKHIIDGLKKDGYHITLKEKMEGNIEFFQFDEITDSINDCDFIICGVSSFGVDWFAENVVPKIEAGKSVLAITKGLQKMPDGSLLPFPLYLSTLRPDVSFNAVGGPCISFELTQRIHTQVAFCGNDIERVRELRDALTTSYYHITATTDIRGIETAVALKNAYAMAVSLAIGLYTKNDPALPEKYNAQAGLFYEATREMECIIELLGGKRNAVAFGAGDLYVTVFGGRTRRLGTILGSGINFEKAKEMLAGVTLESVAIIKLIGEYFGTDINKYPLMNHIYTLITENIVKDIPWSSMKYEY